DTLKRRIDDFYSESSNARAFTQRMKNATRGILNTVPGYQKMTADYAKASEFRTNLKDLSLEAKNDGTALRKFGTLMDKNNRFRQGLVNQLSRYAGRDLQGEIAGLRLRPLTPGGLRNLGDAALGALFLGHSLPGAGTLGAVASTSPRLVGEAA